MPAPDARAHEEPPLSEHDARIVHESVRIDIPIIDRWRLRHVAALLRDLAADLEAASAERLPPADHPDFHRRRRLVLWNIAIRADGVRRRIRELAGGAARSPVPR